jgi:hypothetical protein
VVSGDLVIPPWMTAAKCHSLLNRMGRIQWNVRQEQIYSHGVSVAAIWHATCRAVPISDKRILRLQIRKSSFFTAITATACRKDEADTA